MADKDESQSGISEDTKTMLEEQVKKGKARKFILITKGAAIKTLIVFKKGPYGPKIMQAKKQGFKGEACIGVVSGKGVNLTFQLPGTAEVSDAMKTDGSIFEAEPCKIAKLRKFFLEEAELKFKPEFQVVKSLIDVAAVSELDESEEENLAESTSQDVDSDERKAKLVAAVKKLTASIQQAIANHPQQKDQIMAPLAEIKEYLQGDKLDQAQEKLVEYAEILKGYLANTPQSDTTQPAPPPPPPPPSGDTAKQSEWDWRLKALSPDLKKVLSEKLGDFGQIAAIYKQAKESKESDLAAAVEHLKKCATLVEVALKEGEGEWEDSSAEDFKTSWEEQSALFASQRKNIEARLPDKLAGFDKFVAKAKELANSGDYEGALKIAMKLAELDTAAQKATTSKEVKETIPEHAVEDRKKFLLSRWNDAIKASYIEVEKLVAPIAQQVPDEDPNQLVSGINDALDDFVDDFNTAIIGAQSATPNDLRPLDRALDAINKYRSRIGTHPLIMQLDQAKAALGVDIRVSDQLLKALDDLETRLAG